MIQKLIAPSLVALTIAAVSCGDGMKEQETVDGMKYTIINDEGGRTPDSSDVTTFDFSILTLDDSLIVSSAENGQPARLMIDGPGNPEALSNLLKLFSAGDSVVVRSTAEKLFGPQNTPPNIETTQPITMNIKIQKVQTYPEFETEMQELRAQQMKEQEEKMAIVSAEEDERLKIYLDSMNWTSKAEILESGLVIIRTKKNPRGAQPEAGDKIKAHYTGRILNGEVFDSSRERNKPFEFTVGQGMVIRGWDEGFQQLRVGEKATLLIPSRLGYGANGAGGRIPPYSILDFDVELLEIVE
jgi:FKBP-type peptidyl-prolyl cis-trans isomerase